MAKYYYCYKVWIIMFWQEDPEKRMEELAGLRQQHDLLKTMLQQQEEVSGLGKHRLWYMIKKNVG